MKKQFLSCLLVLFAASAAFNCSIAQSIAIASTPLLNAERGFDYALSDFDNIGTVTNTSPLWLNAVKSKVQRSFEKTFFGVATPKW